jgi:hypothetical protein
MNPKNNYAYPITYKFPISRLIVNVFKKLNFEFMDLESMPKSLRSTLRDILEVGYNSPFRTYNKWTSTSVYNYAKINDIKEIVELGAGCAPISRQLVSDYPNWDVKLIITDLNPDVLNFKNLEELDKRVNALYRPLDFTKRIQGFENSLLVLSASFHHVPENIKTKVISNLKGLSPHVIIFEPLRPNIPSLLFGMGALISGFLTPLFKCNSKKFFRCLLWCWLIPIAPFLLIWDGWVSSMRIWSKKKWKMQEPNALTEETLFCSKTILFR